MIPVFALVIVTELSVYAASRRYSSGLVVARLHAAQDVQDSIALWTKLVFSQKSLRYAALGTNCTLNAVPG